MFSSVLKYIAYFAYLLDFYNIESDDFHLQILFAVSMNNFDLVLFFEIFCNLFILVHVTNFLGFNKDFRIRKIKHC